MPRNIEIKARLRSLDAARRTAEEVGRSHGVEHQIDTYFPCPHGRLKLREFVGRQSQLVWYARPDAAEAKASDYTLTPVADPAPLKAALSAALGVAVVVDKQREIYLSDNVRIHLDLVQGLGTFLEFEAVLGPAADGRWTDDDAGRLQVAELSRLFGLTSADLVTGSYADLLTGR